LERHGHHVVSGADPALVEHTGIGVGTRTKHAVDRVGTPHRRVLAFRALWAGMIEIERERNDLAFFDEAGRGNDVLRRRIVECADLIVGTPFAPIFVLLGSVADVLTGDLSSRH
jgi:hypothetical protein